jgi:N-acyl homoserine lactone hydrolase
VVRAHDIAAHLAADVRVGDERWPVFVHTISHPAGLVLVDTGMIDTVPELAEWDARPLPLPDELVQRVALVVNTHLHFDHCGGNRRFPGVPIHVQRRELADARSEPGYTIPAWVDFPGATYVEHDGEAEVLPGVRLLPAPGHTAGHQAVLVDTDDGLVVLGGDVGYSFRELERGDTEGRRRVLALAAPTYLAHEEQPRVPVLRAADEAL